MPDFDGHLDSIIKVIGVGGGGGNAVGHMYREGIKGVEFFICNTDVQALSLSPIPNRIQIGKALTQGLGAGAKPERGRNAAIENKEDLREILSHNTKMLFITAGMGGGTGTGAAPVIAEVARELGILTVGIVTAPFAFEGKPKRRRAKEGIAALQEHCDTVLVILNDKLREVYGKSSMREAFRQADNVLTKAAKSIAEIITVPGEINVDFEDVRTVMQGAGAAVMGSATAEGENKARRAAEGAISSPLLNNTNIFGSTYILLSIVVGDQDNFQMEELEEITDYIQDQAGEEAEIIFGQAVDETLGESVTVTIIATGFEREEDDLQAPPEKRVYDLVTNKRIKNRIPIEKSTPAFEENDFFDSKASSGKSTNESFVEKKVEQPIITPEIKTSQPIGDKIVFKLEEDEDYHTMDEEEKKKEETVLNNDLDTGFQRETYLNQIQNMQSIAEMTNEEIQERRDVPAYIRRKVKLREMPHSYEQQKYSRYTLNSDNEILGNNRFLHDNVD